MALDGAVRFGAVVLLLSRQFGEGDRFRVGELGAPEGVGRVLVDAGDVLDEGLEGGDGAGVGDAGVGFGDFREEKVQGVAVVDGVVLGYAAGVLVVVGVAVGDNG